MGVSSTATRYNRIIFTLKKVFDRAANGKLRNNFLQALPFWVASILTGVAAVIYSRVFIFAEQTTSRLFLINPWLMFVVTPVLFVLGWWLVHRFDHYAKGSGIPQVMAAIDMANPRDKHNIRKLLNLRIVLVKMLSSFSMILGGGLIGREGPTIQIAGSIFRKVNEALPAWWPKISNKNMIMTGAAAGLAAAFNTPLGGIVFAMEELTKTHISYFKTALFTAVIIAGLTAQALFGPYLYLGYPSVTDLSLYIFLGVMLVALLTGLAGSFTSLAMLRLMDWKKRFTKTGQLLLFALSCGLLVALIAVHYESRSGRFGKRHHDPDIIYFRKISTLVCAVCACLRCCFFVCHGCSWRCIRSSIGLGCQHWRGIVVLDAFVGFRHQPAGACRHGRIFDRDYPHALYLSNPRVGNDRPS